MHERKIVLKKLNRNDFKSSLNHNYILPMSLESTESALGVFNIG